MTGLVIDRIEEDEENITFHVSYNESSIIPIIIHEARQDIEETPQPLKRTKEYWRLDLPFTRSNGTALAKLYERLTKASRRKQTSSPFVPGGTLVSDIEISYRQGVYDGFKALQQEFTIQY